MTEQDTPANTPEPPATDGADPDAHLRPGATGHIDPHLLGGPDVDVAGPRDPSEDDALAGDNDSAHDVGSGRTSPW